VCSTVKKSPAAYRDTPRLYTVHLSPASETILTTIIAKYLQQTCQTNTCIVYTVFHKIGTRLYFGNNFSKCWSTWM